MSNPSNQPQVHGLLKPNEAADLLAMSPRKLWGLMRSGSIAHVRDGRFVRFHPADLTDWIERHRLGAGALKRPKQDPQERGQR